ncbi:MAG: hybrid sensor histidine kinase/response regulator [Deltaproteobacteria bacterium]|nr:hybrid sensor histidine kinase/response regulator [Deltaproteobacteria bacterium]
MQKPSLLIADDEDIIRKRVGLMLGPSFRIQEVSTAKEAMEASPCDFDVILLDIMFPDGNGVDICRSIKKDDPHSTVLINSSMETVEAWNKAFEAGADGYFEKRELLNTDPRKICLMINSLVERNRLRRRTEEINRKQAKLLSVLTHDVRAPFQALLGTMNLLKRSDIPPDLSANVDRMFESANQQLSFINSLLELLRLDSGLTQLRLLPTDVNLAVNQSVQTMTTLAMAKGLKIETELEKDLPKVSGDIGQITRILNNLISNAIKFTNRGGIIRIQTNELLKKGTNGVSVAVSDNGIGISDQDRERLFSPFHRGREKGTDGEVGSGLGLSICKELIELHNGSIELESYPGKGSMFKLWFPLPQ